MYNPQLETFLHVADAGSFNKAAEESFITPRRSSSRSIRWRNPLASGFLTAATGG